MAIPDPMKIACVTEVTFDGLLLVLELSKSIIVDQLDTSREVYFIVSGYVRATYFSLSGKEISFREQFPGEMFGELSAIDGETRSTQILALTDVQLVAMKAEDFTNLIQRTPSLSLVVLRHLLASA